jgi:hypothetical protein
MMKRLIVLLTVGLLFSTCEPLVEKVRRGNALPVLSSQNTGLQHRPLWAMTCS